MPARAHRLLVLGLVLGACAPQRFPPFAPASPNPSESADSIVPLVDYHVHINSLMYAQTNIPPLLPGVRLPDELEDLVVKLGQSGNDRAAIAPLYTDSSVMIRSDVHNWVRGRDAVSTFWSLTFARAYQVIPIAYQAEDSTGWIVAHFARQQGDTLKYRGQLLLALRKEGDGVWRIAAQTLSVPGPDLQVAVTAEQLLAEEDAAGIQRANVLSPAFVFGSGLGGSAPGEYEKVRAENTWIAEQAARHPARITAFCGFNPLKDYALAEVERCGRDPRVKGLKFHFSDSGVNLRDPGHLAKMKEVFRAANRHRLAITAHIATLEKDYDGRATATAFLNELLPLASDVPVQIAHMTGDSGFGPQTDAAFGVFADAIRASDPRTRNLYFDASGVVMSQQGQSAEQLALIASRMRQVGFGRILFASDRHGTHNPTPAEAWRAWRAKLPLTGAEFRDIADNLVPYRP
jgi:predicted TIM-barrel fold metal-dependent hydrolase/ketosteroid isomerase-like protein